MADRLEDGARLRRVLEGGSLHWGLGQRAAASPDQNLVVLDTALDDPEVLADPKAVLAHHCAGPAVPLLCLAWGRGPDALAAARSGPSRA